ncbi:MAG: pirin family protein [Chlorobiota bacterium]|nr:pirin family protein [Chlorobiota bacterium]QQS67328.1 MAG: pirin family protein [Chlorobiota bacterium]
MVKKIYKSENRGVASHGWLNSRFSFSFAGWYNPELIHFGMLRVLNDDIISPGMGFGMHPHENMEIITIVLSGELEHKDTMGNGSVIKVGDVQIMSAGIGLEHSEFNPSLTEETKLLQLWIFPKERNINPRYGQRTFKLTDNKNVFIPVVSHNLQNESLWINQKATISLVEFDNLMAVNYIVNDSGNGAYIFVIDGYFNIENEIVNKRDAIGIYDIDNINIEPKSIGKLLIIDIPMN